MYNRVISDNELLAVQDYLAGKYGINVAADRGGNGAAGGGGGAFDNEQPLVFDAGTARWETESNNTLPDAEPGAYLNLALDGSGHPGRAAGQGGNEFDRVLITKFTIDAVGDYRLGDSYVDPLTDDGDGNNVRVFTNGKEVLNVSGGDDGQRFTFNTLLGSLSVGDVVTVTVGPDGDGGGNGDANDDFDFDYSIIKEQGGPLTVQSGATLSGGGAVCTNVIAEAGSVIHPSGNLTFGVSSDASGLSIEGTVLIDAGDNVTMADQDDVALGPFTTVNGTLNLTSSANGGVLMIDEGDNLSGTGTVNADITTFTTVGNRGTSDNTGGNIAVRTDGTLVAAINFGLSDETNNGVTFVSSGDTGSENGVTFSSSSTTGFSVNDNTEAPADDGLFFEQTQVSDETSALNLEISGLDPAKNYLVEVLHGSVGFVPAESVTPNTLQGFAFDVSGDNGDHRIDLIGNPTDNRNVLKSTPISQITIDGNDRIHYENDGDFNNGNGGRNAQGFNNSENPAYGGMNQNDNFATVFMGQINIPDLNNGQPYNVEFGSNRWDDPGRIHVDLDQDGIFENTAGEGATKGNERVVQRGCCGSQHNTISIAPGTYLYAASMLERGGGSQIEPTINLNDGQGRRTVQPGQMNGLFSSVAINPNPGPITGQYDVALTGTATGGVAAVNDLTFGGDPADAQDAESKKTVAFTVSGESGFTYSITPDNAQGDLNASISGFQVREITGLAGGTISPGTAADPLNDANMTGDGVGRIGTLTVGTVNASASTRFDFDL
ncbi:MAG: hypothetical protein VB876_08715, partial [Pirellulales bacterium]